MNTIELKSYNVSELTFEEKLNIDGGVPPAIVIAGKLIAASVVGASGIAVGALAVYGAYRLVKWLAS